MINLQTQGSTRFHPQLPVLQSTHVRAIGLFFSAETEINTHPYQGLPRLGRTGRPPGYQIYSYLNISSQDAKFLLDGGALGQISDRQYHGEHLPTQMTVQ